LLKSAIVGQAALAVVLVDHAAIAPAARVGRGHFDHFAVIGGGAVELFGIAIGIAAVDVGKHIGGKLDLHAEVRNGARHVALAIVHVAAIAVGDGELRIEFDGGVEIGQGAVEITPTLPGVATIVVGQRKCRIDASCLIIIGHRTIEIALEGVDAAPVGVGTGIGRIKPDRLVEIGQRGVEFTFFG